MDTKVSYTTVGVFVIMMTAIAVGIVLWLTWFRHNQTYDTYVVYMSQEVSGLSVQSAVRFNGVRVGYVSKIELAPQDPQEVKITVQIETQVQVSTAVVATLMSQGITGLDYIGLRATAIKAPPLKVKGDQKYPVIPSEPSLLKRLSASIQDITDDIETVSSSISTLFSAENQRHISEILSGFASVGRVLDERAGSINTTLGSAQVLMKNSAKASQQFPQLVNDLASTTKSIQQLTTELQQTARSVTSTVKTSGGSRHSDRVTVC